MASDPRGPVVPTQSRAITIHTENDFSTTGGRGLVSATTEVALEHANTEQADDDLHRPTLPKSASAWLSLIATLTLAAFALLKLRDWLRGRVERIRYEERRQERAHVARMLHDTLLQGTQGFIFLAQAAANRMGSDDPAKPLLERALSRADATLLEGRGRLHDLRDSDQMDADFALQLASVGRGLAGESPERFRFEVVGVERTMRACAADAALLIGREALVNAFRHSGATVIELRIHHADQHLVINVSDDGCGIGPDVLMQGGLPGHWGLRGMHERAAMIPARLRIYRRSDRGTEVELSINARTAYRSQLRFSWHMSTSEVVHAWRWPIPR